MSNLWTVTFSRLQLVSRFDEHGKKISDEVKEIPVTLHDLPYVTAKTYQDKADDPSKVILVQQFNSFQPGRVEHRESSGGTYARKRAPLAMAARTPDKPAKSTSALADAAASGDLAAAINAEMRDA